MSIQTALTCIHTHFPDIKIKQIRKIGEGTGNIAFEINSDYIFRFPKKKENQKQLEKEISLQEILKKYSPLPFPEFIFIPNDHSFIGYKKLLGTPLLYNKSFNRWDIFANQLSHFLNQLHSTPFNEFNSANIPTEQKSFED